MERGGIRPSLRGRMCWKSVDTPDAKLWKPALSRFGVVHRPSLTCQKLYFKAFCCYLYGYWQLWVWEVNPSFWYYFILEATDNGRHDRLVDCRQMYLKAGAACHMSSVFILSQVAQAHLRMRRYSCIVKEWPENKYFETFLQVLYLHIKRVSNELFLGRVHLLRLY